MFRKKVAAQQREYVKKMLEAGKYVGEEIVKSVGQRFVNEELERIAKRAKKHLMDLNREDFDRRK